MNCMEHLLRTDLNRDWLSLLLIGALVLLGILRYRFPRRMVELMLLPINDKYFALEGRQKGLGHPFNVAMLAIQITAFGLLLASIQMTNGPDPFSLNVDLFLRAVIMVGLYLVFRYALDWCVGYIFKCQKLLAAYRYQRLSFHNLISLVLLFLFAIVFFSRASIQTISPVMMILVVFALMATIIYSLRRNYTTLISNFLYFILYICALEIAPYALLYQAAMA